MIREWHDLACDIWDDEHEDDLSRLWIVRAPGDDESDPVLTLRACLRSNCTGDSRPRAADRHGVRVAGGWTASGAYVHLSTYLPHSGAAGIQAAARALGVAALREVASGV